MSLQFNGAGNVTIPLWSETGDFNIYGTAQHKTALEILIGNVNSVDSFLAVGADVGDTVRAKIAASASFLDVSPYSNNEVLSYELKRVGTLVTLTVNGTSTSNTLTGDVRFNVLGEYINGLNYNGLMSNTLTMIGANNATRTYDMNGTGTDLIDTTSAQNGTLTGGVSFTGLSDIVIAPDNAAIIYSPYNWLVNATEAKSINSGAYLKTEFTSTTCELTLDLTGLVAPYGKLLIRVDGRTFQRVEIATSIIVDMPSDQSNTKHLLEVYIDSTTNTVDRWAQQNAIKITSITLDATGTVTAPTIKPNSILIYGDSITEGANTLTSTAVSDVDDNSSIVCWATKLGELNNSEVGVVGFGGTGFNQAGAGSVPIFTDTYDKLWLAQARDFAVDADLCVFMMGYNDGVTNTVTNGLIVLNGLLAAMPTTNFVLLRPLANTNQESNLITMATTCNDPSRVVYKTTNGFWDVADSPDSVHPYGYSSISDVAINVATIVADSLVSFTGASTPSSSATLTATGVPDASYSVTAFTAARPATFITSESVAFSGGVGNVTLPIAAGTQVYAMVRDNSDPSAQVAPLKAITT